MFVERGIQCSQGPQKMGAQGVSPQVSKHSETESHAYRTCPEEGASLEGPSNPLSLELLVGWTSSVRQAGQSWGHGGRSSPEEQLVRGRGLAHTAASGVASESLYCWCVSLLAVLRSEQNLQDVKTAGPSPRCCLVW